MKVADMRFDVRTQKHRLRRGELSHDELAAFLADLPDEAEEAVETETRFVAAYAAGNDGPSDDE